MWLCLKCSHEYEPGEYRACPGCGDRTGIPADLDKRVTIDLSWLELRVLMQWAEKYAGMHVDKDPTMRKVIYGIADRLQPQVPAELVLTFAGELTQLREHFSDVRTNFPEPPMEAGS